MSAALPPQTARRRPASTRTSAHRPRVMRRQPARGRRHGRVARGCDSETRGRDQLDARHAPERGARPKFARLRRVPAPLPRSSAPVARACGRARGFAREMRRRAPARQARVECALAPRAGASSCFRTSAPPGSAVQTARLLTCALHPLLAPRASRAEHAGVCLKVCSADCRLAASML